jgi:hypothetical protein
MSDRLRESVTNDLDHFGIMIPDRLIGIQNKVTRLSRDLETSGKIYSHQVMELVTDVLSLLKDSAVTAELSHLVQVAEVAKEAPDAPRD